MLVSLRNTEGFVIAYCEFEVVDKQGVRVERGDFLFIRKLWVHSSYRDILLGAVIKKIWRIIKHKGCKYVYWERSKYGFKLSKTYPINRFLKGANRGIKNDHPGTSRTAITFCEPDGSGSLSSWTNL